MKLTLPALHAAEIEVDDPVPESDSWVLEDFVDRVGDHRNRYAKEKYNMVMFAKLTKRGPGTSYSLSAAKAKEVFEELKNSEESVWTKGKSSIILGHVKACSHSFEASWGATEDEQHQDIFADEGMSSKIILTIILH